MRNKRGKILIDGKLYYQELETVQKALADVGFVPFRVEHLAMQDQFELLGCALAFEELEFGHILPEYSLDIVRNTDSGEYEGATVRAV